MSAAAARPLPDVRDPWASPYWEGARRERLLFQRCQVCSYLRWPPTPICAECLTPGGDWVEVPPTGTVWSFAVYEHAFETSFSGDIPYNVALVELDAGPRLISNIVDIDNDALKIGLKVTAFFDHVSSEVTLVKFRPTP
jgi:uncharacterized OB-fold protein